MDYRLRTGAMDNAVMRLKERLTIVGRSPRCRGSLSCVLSRQPQLCAELAVMPSSQCNCRVKIFYIADVLASLCITVAPTHKPEIAMRNYFA